MMRALLAYPWLLMTFAFPLEAAASACLDPARPIPLKIDISEAEEA
jgi:hypothetical protein